MTTASTPRSSSSKNGGSSSTTSAASTDAGSKESSCRRQLQPAPSDRSTCELDFRKAFKMPKDGDIGFTTECEWMTRMCTMLIQATGNKNEEDAVKARVDYYFLFGEKPSHNVADDDILRQTADGIIELREKYAATLGVRPAGRYQSNPFWLSLKIKEAPEAAGVNDDDMTDNDEEPSSKRKHKRKCDENALVSLDDEEPSSKRTRKRKLEDECYGLELVYAHFAELGHSLEHISIEHDKLSDDNAKLIRALAISSCENKKLSAEIVELKKYKARVQTLLAGSG